MFLNCLPMHVQWHIPHAAPEQGRGRGGRGKGSTTRAGLGGGSGAEVALYQLSGGDPEVAPFV